MNESFLSAPMQREVGGYTLHLRQFEVARYASQQSLSHGVMPYGLTLPEDLQRAVAKRQAEFLAGRVAACDALQAAGVPPQMLAVGKHRAPRWPQSVVGSISHNANLALAVAQRVDSDALLLGVDVESRIDEPPLPAIQSTIATAQEAVILARVSLNAAQRVTTLFSAKESLFKALYPRVGQYLEFHDSRLLTWDEANGRLTLQLVQRAAELAGSAWVFEVHYRWDEQRVITLAQCHASS
ncbi:4'-phosphopantetheinyl transferase superfamily protein [Vibrio fluvialis]|uniref:4'-phosphopantetheinyl transferase family protein n=1 Tax=Vibrio fluvialis TaxID=676 RepID=UPI00192C7B7C|nr:4'-phosphopantetheinyl transferase superfamily protein [Vibrio fluvialis]MBL4241136.1 4'-phosphopantetheinyl transferase superfamily protein [Vibrio fluvialis]MBL4250087.1 4'-phosphopantetheinyl transferase superfamily protein [Vibrio fluvialis]MBY8110400.1 4'-phosphopantetheinyl transferase superfamily protein [Vibrio fluvialis]MBY8213905.1 4'-phosphopantetheinyl transferase superfamily protein [Vibrio fluvialis]MBY8293635.1 4'-phosphopantetheinyl transferase superfamily protein [Vibrio fl